MSDQLSNIIDFGEVFNAIRLEQRELIKREIDERCQEGCEITCNDIKDLIDSLPMPGNPE